jgi:sRNA-binding regulator protein Hfq
MFLDNLIFFLNTTLKFKEMQVKHFPDFDSRVSLEKQQGIIYRKAVKKIKEYRRISPLLDNYQKWLTDEEKSAINYFHGIGIYAKFQDPKITPNILDTRKTFLKKMENKDMREKFLEAYNRLNPIE